MSNDTAKLVVLARDPAASLQKRQAAFSRLVEQYERMVRGLALARLRDVDDAEDAAQEAFATAWRRLHQIRDPSAFESWIKSVVARMCSRQRRKRRGFPPTGMDATSDETSRLDYSSVVADALRQLSDGERVVVVLFYFMGYTQSQISRLMQLKPGTVAKRLHSARLRMRSKVPRSVRRDFVQLVPSRDFIERVRHGLLDEYTGTFRFDERPDHLVSITREGDSLISHSAGQRHVLVDSGQRSLLTVQYDGEGRFGRNRKGEVTHFVYYEFGKRLGTARRVPSAKINGVRLD